MANLNYHHLLYFWTVARAGSISKASVELGLTQPTISEQLRLLEVSLDRKLFDRVGRSLVLTDTGHLVFDYADKIFALGNDLTSAVAGRAKAVVLPLRIMVDQGVGAELIAHALRPLVKIKQTPQLFIERGSPEEALPQLSRGKLDLFLSTNPGTPKSRSGAFRHLLFECGTAFYASARLSRSGRFPGLLRRLPFFTPADPVASQLQHWFKTNDVETNPAGELADPEIALALAEIGFGAVALPDVPRHNFGLKLLGRTKAIRTRLYAFTRQRRPKEPSLVALLHLAQPGRKPRR